MKVNKEHSFTCDRVRIFAKNRNQTTRLASYVMTLPPRENLGSWSSSVGKGMVCCAHKCSPRVHTVSKILNKRRIFHPFIVTLSVSVLYRLNSQHTRFRSREFQGSRSSCSTTFQQKRRSSVLTFRCCTSLHSSPHFLEA